MDIRYVSNIWVRAESTPKIQQLVTVGHHDKLSSYNTNKKSGCCTSQMAEEYTGHLMERQDN